MHHASEAWRYAFPILTDARIMALVIFPKRDQADSDGLQEGTD